MGGIDLEINADFVLLQIMIGQNLNLWVSFCFEKDCSCIDCSYDWDIAMKKFLKKHILCVILILLIKIVVAVGGAKDRGGL